MIQGLIQNIENDFSLDDINKLHQLLISIKKKKEDKLSHGITTIENFCTEYTEYIKNTLSPSYLRSVKLSFKILIHDFGKNKKLGEISIKDAEDFKIRRESVK